MTRQEFFEINNGRYLEIAGTSALNQCTDNANAYIRYVLRLPIIEWTNAVDFPSKVSDDDYKWIPNSATNVPEEGDLVIWGMNQYGHIAVFIEGDANTFRSFDENYPTGSPCHVQEHNYDYVNGWLHPKASSASNPPQPQQPVPTNLVTISSKLVVSEIYRGILGVDATEDEVKAREAQLDSGTVLHDIVSQILQDDGRSPLKIALENLNSVGQQLKDALSANRVQADVIADLRKELAQKPPEPPVTPSNPSSIPTVTPIPADNSITKLTNYVISSIVNFLRKL
ncbi:MAG: CHAP domain-containing protein [Candidatus Micrarchaeota archaeon]|nr:CHAP domain-containing protein [Candidatus Micrarchaeota archaeon]